MTEEEQYELARLRRLARGFRPDVECERLIELRRDHPEIFALVPPYDRGKVEPYLDRKRAYERVRRLDGPQD